MTVRYGLGTRSGDAIPSVSGGRNNVRGRGGEPVANFTQRGGGAGAPILISATPAPSATITTYSGYIVFKFTSSGTLNVGAGAPGVADAFVLGGGGSGQPAPGGPGRGGTGGGGGQRIASPGVTITSNTPIPVTVGGAGSTSSFGPVTSSGGSGGGGGGLGGLGQPNFPVQQSQDGFAGTNGPSNDYLTGSPAVYGGGGGGGGGAIVNQANFRRYGGAGGQSGGGAGGDGNWDEFTPSFQLIDKPATPGVAGQANTGGGGGGGGMRDAPLPVASGGTGGSGIVIVRFPDAQFTTV